MLSFKERIEKHKTLYRTQGQWGDATLADFWNMAKLSFPDKEAIRDESGYTLTYKALDVKACQLADYFVKQGLEPNDVVTFQVPGWTEFVIIYIACIKAGVVCNPVLPNLRDRELEHILTICKSKLFICPNQYRDYDYASMAQRLVSLLEHEMSVLIINKEHVENNLGFPTFDQVLISCSPTFNNSKCSADDLAAIMFTSGTESLPKGVMLTHNNIISSERAFIARLHINYQERILVASPPAHALGFHHALTVMILVGCSCILHNRFKAVNALEEIERSSCTLFMGPASFVLDMIKIQKESPFDISSLRVFLCGGAPIPSYLYKEAKQVGIKLIGCYGSTESCPHVLHHLEDSDEKVCTSDGVPIEGTEVRVVDENRQEVSLGQKGEEASRGPAVFVGYMGDPKLTAEVLDDNGWFYSGDYCQIDSDGYIRIVGRKKDVIVRGGENISSVEVENILLQHPNIYGAAVIGMPDFRLGERICAYIILENPDQPMTVEDLQRFFVHMKFDKWICPERIEFVDSLPFTPTGKVKKYLLRQDISRKLEKE